MSPTSYQAAPSRVRHCGAHLSVFEQAMQDVNVDIFSNLNHLPIKEAACLIKQQ